MVLSKMVKIKFEDEIVGKVRKHIEEGDSRFDFPNVEAFVKEAVYVFLKDKLKKK